MRNVSAQAASGLPGPSVFEYPALLQTLEDPYPEAPGWTMRLPAGTCDLVRNAEAMSNCTGGYVNSILDWSCFIVIITGPDRERFNASVEPVGHPEHGRYRVIDVRGVCNSRDVPEWIRPAITARLNTPATLTTPETADTVPPHRPTPHRDRRRARASRARRARRSRRG